MGEADKVNPEEFRRSFEAINRQDWAAAQTLQHPDIAWYDPPEVPDAGVHVGLKAVRDYWADELFDSWETWWLDLDDLIISGDFILTFSRLNAKAKHSGIEQSIDLFQVFKFKDGLVIEQRGFFDREQAMAAAGIDPGAS